MSSVDYSSPDGSAETAQWTAHLVKQLHAYIAWVNSHLKRRTGSRLVSDLKTDVCDGVALIQLLETLSGDCLGGNAYPKSYAEMRENVQRVINFMQNKRIRMHQTQANDIVDGNIKCIMRLILALAVHYQPDSVKQSVQQQVKAQQSVMDSVQHAAVSLAETRRDISSVGLRVRRPELTRTDDHHDYANLGARSESMYPYQSHVETRASTRPQDVDGPTVDHPLRDYPAVRLKTARYAAASSYQQDTARRGSRDELDRAPYGSRDELERAPRSSREEMDRGNNKYRDIPNRDLLESAPKSFYLARDPRNSVTETQRSDSDSYDSQRRGDWSNEAGKPPLRSSEAHDARPTCDSRVKGNGRGRQRLDTRPYKPHAVAESRYVVPWRVEPRLADSRVQNVGLELGHGDRYQISEHNHRTTHSRIGQSRPMTKSKSLDFDTMSSEESSLSDNASRPVVPAIPISPIRAPLPVPQLVPETVHQQESVPDLADNLDEDHSKLADDLKLTKQTLLKLQTLLLHGQYEDNDSLNDEGLCEGSNAEEQVVILKSHLQQADDITNYLRDDVSKLKAECLEMQMAKESLQERLSEQERENLQVKAELLRMRLAQDAWQAEKTDLQNQVDDREFTLRELKRDVSYKDRLVTQLQSDLDMELTEKESISRSLKYQLRELHEKMRRVGESEAHITTKLVSQDQAMSRLEGRLTHNQPNFITEDFDYKEDLDHMSDLVRGLKQNLSRNDPQHRTIDCLDGAIRRLSQQLTASEQALIRRGSTEGGLSVVKPSTRRVAVCEPRTSPVATVQPNFQPTTQHHPPPPSNGQKPYYNAPPPSSSSVLASSSVTSSMSSANQTKVLYFTDTTVTPFLSTIPKRLGEITLTDFKQVHDKPGKYRYHFKTLDPEFGTVKEEIGDEDALLPGWEGKIVGWIEDDN